MNELDSLVESAQQLFAQAHTPADLENAKAQFLGKSGKMTELMKGMAQLSVEEKKSRGAAINVAKQAIEAALTARRKALADAELEAHLKAEVLDVTLPGKRPQFGAKHPLSIVLDEIKEIFIGMGFEIADGPEVETDYYNFEALNIPKDHPARDTQDTFYINDNIVLRTQTSPVQIRVMEKTQPPIRIIAPGRVFRSDAVDATHSPLFHQIEGLVVDKGITMADLKGTLETFAKRLYGEDAVMRFRPSGQLRSSRNQRQTHLVGGTDTNRLRWVA